MLGHPIAPLSGVVPQWPAAELLDKKEIAALFEQVLRLFVYFFKKIPISEINGLSNKMNRKSLGRSRFQMPVIHHRQKVDRVLAGLLD